MRPSASTSISSTSSSCSSRSWGRATSERAFALTLALSLFAGTARAGAPVLASPSEVASARKGVVVVGLSADATWPVAQAVYGDAGLRPKLGDAAARVLAGEAPKEGAPADVRGLAELRAQVKGDDAASRAILAEIARRTGARAITVVSVAADGAVEVRVFDAASGELEGTRHRKEASGWSPFVGVLHGRFAPAAEPAKPEPTPEKKKSGSFFENPWFWVALGGAAVAGVTVYALTRSDSTPAPVVLSWK